jgi:hypothetical protein
MDWDKERAMSIVGEIEDSKVVLTMTTAIDCCSHVDRLHMEANSYCTH